jgi:acyl-CoA thioester hydrolase
MNNSRTFAKWNLKGDTTLHRTYRPPSDASMPHTDFKFCHRFRVRWSEVDPQGVVFNARYLDYGDLAITEYWRAVGFRTIGEEALEFHVAHAGVDFKKPIKPDEVINAWARTERIGNSSMTILIELHGHRDDNADDLRAVIREVSVHVDLESHSPLSIPNHVRDEFGAFDNQNAPILTGIS